MEKKFLDKIFGFFFIFFNLNESNALLVQVWSLATSFFVGGSRPGFFLTDIEKTQGENNSPNSITQGNFLPKTQRTGSIFDGPKKLNKPVLI